MWASPIFFTPPVNPRLWDTQSPKISKAFNAYRNFDYQKCLLTLGDEIVSIEPSNHNDWLKVELRLMSLVQLGAIKDIRDQLSSLRKILDSPKDLNRLELLSAVTELWIGEEDARISGIKLRNLRSNWKKVNDVDLQIITDTTYLTYLWREERIEDMPLVLRDLEKNLSKLFDSQHPAWTICNIYKVLVQTIIYEAQNRYIKPLYDQIETANIKSKIRSSMYKHATRGFCYVHKGETSRGLRHLESALHLLEKHIGSSSTLTLQFAIKLGNLLWDNNQFTVAHNLAHRLHKICNETLGPKSKTTIRYRILLAKCMMRMRRATEALSLLTKSLNALNPDKQIRVSAEIHLQLGMLLLEKSQYLEAERHLNLGRSIASRHFQPNHSIIDKFQRLAVVLKSQKNSISKEIISPVRTILLE